MGEIGILFFDVLAPIVLSPSIEERNDLRHLHLRISRRCRVIVGFLEFLKPLTPTASIIQDMYSIKGGWAGQTFALAKSFDSGGKKARIRRSKDERKAMVESFIERYQKSNKGNFPSLSLTHKEVGGSYYIVRDIVRDIIQENRVLGSGMLATDEHTGHSSLEHFPLGSISTQPQIQMLSSDEPIVMTELNHNSTTEHENQREKNDSSLKKNPSIFGQEPDESFTILSSTIDDETREYQFPCSLEKMPGPIEMQSVSEDAATHYKETVLENESKDLSLTNAFPGCKELSSIDQLQSSVQLSTRSGIEISSSEYISNGSNQPGSNYKEYKENNQLESQVQDSTDDVKHGENEQEVKDLSIQLEAEVVVETFPLRPVLNNSHEFDQGLGESYGTINHLVKNAKDKSNSFHESIVSVQKAGQATEVSVAGEKTVIAPPSDSIKGVMERNDIADTSGASATIKPINAANEIHHDSLIAEDIIDSPKKCSPLGTTTRNSRQNVQHASNSKKGSNPTLNRINLETWEGRPKPDANPLLALFKSFITAFVKFWTE